MNWRLLYACWAVWCLGGMPAVAQMKRSAPTPRATAEERATDSSAEELFDPTTPVTAAPTTTSDEPGYLGAVLDDRQETTGVRVLQVVPSGPADRGGLQQGDLIHEAGGKTIRGMNDLGRVLAKCPAGAKLNIDVERSATPDGIGEIISLQVTLAARPPAAERPYQQFGRIEAQATETSAETPLDEQPLELMLGVRARQLDRDWRTQLGVPVGRGALVTSVLPDSAAGRAGIRPKMVIVAVNNRAIASPDDLTERLSQSDPAQPLELAYYTGAQLHRVQITLPRFTSAEGDSLATDSQDSPSDHPEFERPTSQPAENAATAKIKSLENHIRQLEAQIDSLEQRIKSLERAPPKRPAG